MTKTIYKTCKNCGEEKVKVVIKESFDEVDLSIKKCENCNYQNLLKDLHN